MLIIQNPQTVWLKKEAMKRKRHYYVTKGWVLRSKRSGLRPSQSIKRLQSSLDRSNSFVLTITVGLRCQSLVSLDSRLRQSNHSMKALLCQTNQKDSLEKIWISQFKMMVLLVMSVLIRNLMTSWEARELSRRDLRRTMRKCPGAPTSNQNPKVLKNWC